MSERGSEATSDEGSKIIIRNIKIRLINNIKIKISININRNPDNKDIM